jgi:predicted enzyme related to lactoylglutathione lyase
MGKLIHFEITGTDSASLADFYSKHFGFATYPSPFIPGYHLLEAEKGISGAVMDSAYQKQPAILWFEVDDIDAKVEAILGAGGATAGEKSTIPGQGHVQYIQDPQGNIVGLKQPLG